MSVATYTQAQQKLLARFGIVAESRFVDVPAVDGRAHVLITGEGPPVMMVIGGGVPTAIWAPLMAELTGFTLYAVDPPGMGLTTRVPYTTEGLRTLAVEFLDQVVERLGLDRPVFLGQSMGGLWATWLALDRPGRVSAIVYIGCPALHAALRLRGPRPQVELTEAQLARLTQPVKLIWGDHDPFGSPSVGERAARIIPDAELHVVPGGHGPWVNQPALVASLVAPFLRRHSAAWPPLQPRA